MIVEDLYISTPTFEVIQPLIITSRLFGLFPISYKKNGNNYCLKWSIVYGVYSYSLSVGLVLWTITGIALDMKREPQHSLRMTDEKTRFVTGGDFSIVVIIVIFGTLTLHLKVKKFWKLMITLNQADSIIPFKNSKRTRKASIIFLSTIVGAVSFLMTFDIATWFLKMSRRGMTPIYYLRYYFAFYVLYTIIIMKEAFYWHVIFLIKIRISLLNKDLKKMKEIANFKDGNCFLQKIVGKDHLDKVSGSTVRQIGRNTNTAINAYIKNNENIDLGKRLITLSIFHDRIFEAVGIVNNSFEFCIHVIMLSCLLHLIVTPYFLLKGLFGDGELYYILLQSAWLIGHIGRVLIIVEPCQYCINEHKKTSGIICEMLSHEVDEELKKAMTILSLQISYCKLQFSSCGFFKINRSLLTSIAGAVTTYLVILFQFNDT
ncbi:unnamed protein product [Psylliodes chrysocephalus]|uniref:Gustatory receptor n=1 Tax=Psylliodes chrysocephalus TaxID=3402493 RepID=A0A9P0DFD5_9CUCU|nr:unnamed protein product [Psylliodes chrysocephala]